MIPSRKIICLSCLGYRLNMTSVKMKISKYVKGEKI